MVVEVAFGRLKACWRRLSKQIDIHIDNVPNIIIACCILHNMCEVHDDTFNKEWLQDFNNPESEPDLDTIRGDSRSSSSHDEGVIIRNTLVQYLLS